MLTLTVSAISVATLAFVGFYYRRLRNVNKQYLESRHIVEGIVTTFKRRYDGLQSGLQQLRTEVSALQSTTQEVARSTAQLTGRLEASLALGPSKTASDELLNNVSVLREEVRQLKEAQEALKTQVSSSLSSAPLIGKRQSTLTKKDNSISNTHNLTETETLVLQFLLNEGPKTAREVEAKIGKTREHTARLMKKLWEQGYIERETHKIPFTYKAADALRTLERPPG